MGTSSKAQYGLKFFYTHKIKLADPLITPANAEVAMVAIFNSEDISIKKPNGLGKGLERSVSPSDQRERA